jgi:hypothetical protein
MEKKHEYESLMEKYFFSKSTNIVYRSNDADSEKEKCQKVVDVLTNPIKFDAPDMYKIIDGKVLLIEHFEFDASRRTKKGGSTSKSGEARVLKEFNSIDPTNKNLFLGEIKNECAIEFYFENLKKKFQDHYKKIDVYKARIADQLENKELETELCFLIEDTTLLGCANNQDGNLKGLQILQIKEFLDLFEESKEIDYILFGLFNGSNYEMFFTSRENINLWRETEITLDSIKFFNFPTPQFAGFKVLF